MSIIIRLVYSLLIFLPAVSAGGGTGFLNGQDEVNVNTTVGQSNLEINALVRSHSFSDYNLLQVYHRNIVTSVERLLGSLEDYSKPIVVEEGYNVSTNQLSSSDMSVILRIDSVQVDDDGMIIFMLSSNSAHVNQTKEIELTVFQALDSLKIRFGDLTPTTSETYVTVDAEDRDNLTTTISCIAEGSNPATTDIHLTLDGEDVPLSDLDVVRQAEVRKYMTQTSTGDLTIAVRDDSYNFQCVATDPTGETHNATVKVAVSGVQGHSALPRLILLLAVMILYV